MQYNVGFRVGVYVGFRVGFRVVVYVGLTDIHAIIRLGLSTHMARIFYTTKNRQVIMVMIYHCYF